MATHRDFFGFSTSLKPLELKALGELSEVRHLFGGERIYDIGDDSDKLFIISRGMVEVVRDEPAEARSYLSRGDIFGDVETLCGSPRTHMVRSCDGVSLRVFHSEKFTELLQRVPSFFRYLSEQLAFRLMQARDTAVPHSQCRELSGSLSQFDLVTIYQTITNSSQTGELEIRDDAGQVQGTFWFDTGRPRSGHFHHLLGEEAFSQLFLTSDLTGTFSFDSRSKQSGGAVGEAAIAANGHELLIRALQMRDELQQLKAEFPEMSALLRHAAPALDLEKVEEAVRPIAQKIWKLSLDQAISAEVMLRSMKMSEMTVLRALSEMVRSGHL